MTKPYWIRITLFGGFILLLVGCNKVDAPPLPDKALAQPAAPPTVTATQVVSKTAQPAPSARVQALVEQAKADLAQRLSFPINQIDFLEAKSVTWSDDSLGCPEPGENYAQVLVNGYRVILEVEGKKYDYHIADRGYFFLCEGGSLRASPNGTPSGLLIRNFDEQGIASSAAEDLASRLGFPIKEIGVMDARRTEVPLATPCGGTTKKDETGPLGGGLTMGYEILLKHRNTLYRYVVSGSLLNFCGEQ